MSIKEVLQKLRAIKPGHTKKVNGHMVTRKWAPQGLIHGRLLSRNEALYYVDAWGKTPLYEDRAAYACVTKGKR